MRRAIRHLGAAAVLLLLAASLSGARPLPQRALTQSAYALDGLTQYATADGAEPSGSGYTYAAVVKVAVPGATVRVFGFGHLVTADQHSHISIDSSGQFRASLRNGASPNVTVTATDVTCDGEWRRVIATVTASAVTIRVGGGSAFGQAWTGTHPSLNATTIGALRYSGGTIGLLPGSVSAASWDDRVMSGDEQEAWLSGRRDPCHPAWGWEHCWQMGDKRPGATTVDSSTTIYDRGLGTAVNASVVGSAAPGFDREVQP